MSSHQSWSNQIFQAAPEHTHSYSNTAMGKKITHKRPRTITPGLVLVDQAFICTKSTAGHGKITSYTVKHVLLSRTPIRKGPGDLIAMIEALESAVWKQENHLSNGFTGANLRFFNHRFTRVRTIHDSGLRAIIEGAVRLIHSFAIRRTNESRWFHSPLRL